MIKRADSPPESVVELLKNTLIGTEGSLYQLLDTETKIHDLHRPHFIFFERNQRAIANLTICRRAITLSGNKSDSLYIRYVAVDTIFQGSSKQGSSQSNFHSYFKELFETSNMDPIDAEQQRSIYWAFIDPQNMRSFNLNKSFGFQTIGTFTTKAFSRVKPRQVKGVERVHEDDKPSVLNQIKSFYQNFDFFSDVHLFEHGNYYIYKYQGEIVAGIQANPSRFKIKSLPGIKGKILIKILPFIPRLRKLINPKNHKFIATEGLFWKEGHEDKIERLLEGVLYESSHHSLLIWTDENNQMLDNLSIKWGLIEKTKEQNEINIVAKFNQYSESEIELIKGAKKYLSGFDMT